MPPEPDYFPPQRVETVAAAARVEDAACRAACRAAGVAAAHAARLAGKAPASPLTFADLATYAGFPVRPLVTGRPLDDPAALLARPLSSRLYAAWAEALARGDHPRDLVLVARGPAWGLTAVYTGKYPDRPHAVVGPAGNRLVIEAFGGWCRALAWGPDDLR